MSLQNVSNHKQLLIGKNAPTLPTAGTVATPSSLADGALAVTTLDGVILSDTTGAALADTTQIVIVQGQGSTKPLIKSTPFSRKDVINAKAKKYTLATQQVSTVGYNGTSGNIVNPGVGTSIILRNTFKTKFYQFSDKLMESVVGYKVTAADTIFPLADALTKGASQDVQKYVNIPYKVERLFNGTRTAATAATTGNYIRLVYQRPYEDFDASTDEPDFPQEWFDAIKFGLADRLAPEYGVPIVDRNDIKNRAMQLKLDALMAGTEEGSFNFMVDRRGY